MSKGGGGLCIRFWGTRGSLPAPGRDTSLFGGNTSCIEVRAGNQLIILDCGSGMRLLGNELVGTSPLEAHVLLTHYHWDHIMGLPFFAPLFMDGNTIHLYGETKQGMDVREVLSGQMIKPYFPVSMGIECQAEMPAHAVAPGDEFDIAGVRASCCRLNHPGDALGFRLDYGNRSVVYATDIEHGTKSDSHLEKLARDADVLIYDATYTEAEYEKLKGWGHSTWRAGVTLARSAGVKHLVLFHHLPERTDQQVAALEREAKREFEDVTAAREGMTLELPEGGRVRVLPDSEG